MKRRTLRNVIASGLIALAGANAGCSSYAYQNPQDRQDAQVDDAAML